MTFSEPHRLRKYIPRKPRFAEEKRSIIFPGEIFPGFHLRNGKTTLKYSVSTGTPATILKMILFIF